jgi:ABC-type sugar transport system permease subunit
MIALAVFVIFDPYLWANPLGRLRESVFYHAQYSSGASEVTSANFAIWQPFIWLTMSPALWHPMVFAFAPDLFITILAGFGIQRLWRKEKVFVLWLASALVFLLLWQTKWPQYILVLTIPLALAAGEAIGGIAENAWDAVKRFRKQDKVSARMDRRRLKQSAPWLIPGAIIFILFTIVPLLYQIAISLTDFNSAAIRDGLNGGVWREVIGGLTGQITPSLSGYPSRANTVHYTGPQMYFPVLNFIAGDGFLVFTTLWTILSVGLQTLLGLGAALLIWNKRIPLRRFWQALFILPWAIPETIGALMWLTIFAPHSGWLFLAVQDFGKDIPFAFLNGWEASPNSIMLVLLIAGLWYGFPFMMLAAAAALKQVSSDVLDAAAIDGANPWQLIRHVILPLLSPLIIPAVIIRGIFAFNQFYLLQTFLFLHEDGSFQTLAGLSYNIFNPSGFYGGAGQFSTSAVLNILTILILSGFVIAFNRWSKADEGVDYA